MAGQGSRSALVRPGHRWKHSDCKSALESGHTSVLAIAVSAVILAGRLCFMLPLAAQEKESFDYFAPSSGSVSVAEPTNNTSSASKPVAAQAGAATPTVSEPKGVRLWIEWGNGKPRQWNAEVRVSDGSVSQLRPMGYAADEPGSMYVEDGIAYVRQTRARQYDSMSLLVNAPVSAKLTIEMSSVGSSSEQKTIDIPLLSLLETVHRDSIDKQGNKLIVRRAPGDELRLKFQRQSLVLAPKEVFNVTVQPHLVRVEPNAIYRCQVQVYRAREDQQLWIKENIVQSDDQRQLPPITPFPVRLPGRVGAYDIVVSFGPQQEKTPFSKTDGWPYQRRLQVVVVDGKPDTRWNPIPVIPESRVGGWHVVGEIDPVSLLSTETLETPSNPIERLRQSNVTNLKPTQFGRIKARQLDQPFVELAPGAWQAIPIAVATVGRPHIVEIDYPTGVRQTLGISILEPNAAGEVVPLGLDSGIDVTPQLGDRAAVRMHQIKFWPRTKSPVILLMNCRRNAPGVYGQIRVRAGPQHLPTHPNLSNPGDRLLAAYYDRPYLTENFSATQFVDGGSRRLLKDWRSFHDAGNRLIEYLRHAGYNGAIMCVARDGGAIYPSQLLNSTPRFDNGAFFTTAQDPLQKDVPEMLLRMFNQSQMTFIPAIHFSAPLPALETLRRKDNSGITLAHADGRSLKNRTSGAIYNPLDPRVQRAMRDVIKELAARYAEHPSFGGIALQLDGKSYAQFPDEDWGCDDLTLARFASDSESINVKTKDEGGEDDLLRLRWLDWRAKKLAEFYEQIQKDIAAAKPEAKLYLTAANPFAGLEANEHSRPTNLADGISFDDKLLRVGIKPDLFADKESIVLLRSELTLPRQKQGIDLQLAHAAEKDKLFNSMGTTGALTFNRPLTIDLLSFKKRSPFGAEKTQARFASHIAPTGFENRRRFIHSLAALDAQCVVDGGWIATTAHDETLQQYTQVYRQLPAKKFETVKPRRSTGQPVVVRRATHENQTFLYAANDSRWPVTVSLEFSSGKFELKPLGDFAQEGLVQEDERPKWTFQLEPYGLVGAKLSEPKVRIVDWHAKLEEGAVRNLSAGIEDLGDRISTRRGPPINVLENPDFELTSSDDPLPGWQLANGRGMVIAIDRRSPQSGGQALQLQSIKPAHWANGPVVWARSNTFSPPETGRLAISAWVRTSNPSQQPRVRMALEGQLFGERYYVYSELGDGDTVRTPQTKLNSTWTPYVLAVTNLPAAGLSDLRIGFDLRGTGEVWIDNVQLYDLWLTSKENAQLRANVDHAAVHLQRGNVTECQQLLDSYSSQLLRRRIPRTMSTTRLAREPAGVPTPSPNNNLIRVKANAPQRSSPSETKQVSYDTVPTRPEIFRLPTVNTPATTDNTGISPAGTSITAEKTAQPEQKSWLSRLTGVFPRRSSKEPNQDKDQPSTVPERRTPISKRGRPVNSKSVIFGGGGSDDK